MIFLILIQRIMRRSDVDTTSRCYIKNREETVTAGMAQLEAELRGVEALRLESESQKAEKATDKSFRGVFLNHPRTNSSCSARNG
jgi:hypothetical protein